MSLLQELNNLIANTQIIFVYIVGPTCKLAFYNPDS
jgi:hypothetical protein